MTTDQSLRKLFSKRGWYCKSGIPEGTARAYKKRFLENSLELETRTHILKVCGFRLAQEMQWEETREPEKTRLGLEKKLLKLNALWSYDLPANLEIPDDVLIEKVLLHLDLDEVKTLFVLFEKQKIRKIWKERMLSQEPLYHGLNRLYAFLLFGIKHPDRYLRDHASKRIKSLS